MWKSHRHGCQVHFFSLLCIALLSVIVLIIKALIICRYNAEKKKIGMYYSTPVYQFRMKCHLCDNHFEIKTDPGVSSVLIQELLYQGLTIMLIFTICSVESRLCHSIRCKKTRKQMGSITKQPSCSRRQGNSKKTF